VTAVAGKQLKVQGRIRQETSIGTLLLEWYDRERRDLPWRYAPGKKADAYRVWLSEIMLQQTVVKTVIPYYAAFLERWPTVKALAAASVDDVLVAWAGLGYYSRARNLHKCAQVVVADHGARFPKDEVTLLTLPGIGPYTAAAIAAIAYGAKVTPVDGNVERVVARLFALEAPLPAVKREITRLAATLTPDDRTGDFAQAMMDLGATVCTPKRPSCLMCPLHRRCEGYAQGIQGTLPRKGEKSARPDRFGHAFLALREDGHVLLRQRPDSGLLARMIEVPSTDWLDDLPALKDAMRAAPVRGDWWPVPGVVTHVFTHFKLELVVHVAIVPTDAALTFWADSAKCRWVSRRALGGQALPSVMRKIIAHALKEM
jgi:A/G-specific adenine glycosylase